MSVRLLTADALARALSLRDLTDPAAGPHALQLLVDAATAALAARWGARVVVHRGERVVPLDDNYDRLHYPPEGAARDARYTRYVTPTTVLRTQTSALVPPLLVDVAAQGLEDALLVCPGIVYRRDCIDRLHTGEPHQLDLWRVRRGPRLGEDDLEDMIRVVVEALLPGRVHRTVPASHPYTTCGRQVDVLVDDEWLEIGECGLAKDAILEESGHDLDDTSGLALGIGLDRLLMIAKGIDDIRLLRSSDPRVSGQMLDLTPWRPVSTQPPLRRDLSVAVGADITPEELGDRVREALGDASRSLEAVELLSETPGEALPEAARARLGLRPGQKNVLVRIVIRDLERTLTAEEGNALRDDVYAALHEGEVHQWASERPPGRSA